MLHRRLRLPPIALGALLVALSSAGSAAGAGRRADAALLEATGVAAAQVTSRPVCGAAASGHASCDAEALVDSRTGALLRPRDGTPLARPDTSADQGPPASFTPQFLQQAYDLGWLAGNAGGGQTVAIVDAYGDANAVADLNTFRAEFGLPSISGTACTSSSIAGHSGGGPCLVIANQQGLTSATDLPGPYGGWDLEQSLDLDAVSSLCPQCNILLIEANTSSDLDLAAGDAEALRLGAKLISNSFGGPASSDGNEFTNVEDQTGDASGSETFAATGDDGAYVDGAYPLQTSPDQAPYPASEDYITAVGGTALDPSGGARGISEVAWSGAGSACARLAVRPAWQSSSATGCGGRASSDLSADADPETGLWVYDSAEGGWSGPYGGTSLSTPLTAAFVALTGANRASSTDGYGLLSGQWAYADSAQLNDVTAGSNGNQCTGAQVYDAPQICNAGPGWDGPTGVGSISGDLVTANAGPSLTLPPTGGIDTSQSGYSLVQSISGTSATLEGGVYPNDSPTEVWWEYGTDAATDDGADLSLATPTPVQSDVGSGTAPVLAQATTVNGLSEGSIYYVSECASNHSGADVICGNATELPITDGPTPEGAPTLTFSGFSTGSTVTIAEPAWTPGPTAVAYQWQLSTDGSSWSSAGSASSYTIGDADLQKFIRVAVTEADASGSTTAYSDVAQIVSPPATGDGGAGSGGDSAASSSGGSGSGSGATPAPAPAPALIVRTPALQGRARVGSVIQVTGGSFANDSAVTVSFDRCARRCVIVQQGPSTSYRLRNADAGHFITATISLAGSDGGASARADATGLLGPVTSPTVGSLDLTAGRATLASGADRPLLRVTRRIQRSRGSGGASTYLVSITPATHIRGSLKGIFCWRTAAQLDSCTATLNFRTSRHFSATVTAGQTLELIATR